VCAIQMMLCNTPAKALHSVQQRPVRGRKFLPCMPGFNCVAASVKRAIPITKSTAGRRRQPFATLPAQRRGHSIRLHVYGASISQFEFMGMTRFL
jgi:hypothetical protein